MSYRLADYDYALPGDLIAQVPAAERTGSRLLHVDGMQLLDHRFTDLTELVAPGDLIVFNDTRVIKARLHGRRPTGGRVELIIERIVGGNEAWVQLRASHPPKVGQAIELDAGVTAEVLDREDRFFRLRFAGVRSLADWLDANGTLPLPPYIARMPGAIDTERYQTIYARESGAVAAPTAGLHFDATLLAALTGKGAVPAYVTLHVGSGTFQPVTEEDVSRHRMHAERYVVPAKTAAAFATTRAQGGRILAVGTTTLRTLESATDASGTLRAGAGQTDLFILPGYRFRAVDRLLTNFHLPRSTLLMLVAAFAGLAATRAAYAHAIAARYRFYSYGDAMLLERGRHAPTNGTATG